MLQPVTLIEDINDAWIWEPSSTDGKYTVSSAFSLIQGLELEEPITIFGTLWQGAAP